MNKEKGFSLLEILVAFAVLALSLGILLRIFSGGVNTAVVAGDYTMAIQIAESLLARTGVEAPLQEGQSSGMEADTYSWEVSVTPYETSGVPQDPNTAGFALMQVEVSVSWDEGRGEPRRVGLTTLKLVNNAP